MPLPDLPQIQPGPSWLRLLKPWSARPAPVPAAVQAPVPPATAALFSVGAARWAWSAGDARNQ